MVQTYRLWLFNEKNQTRYWIPHGFCLWATFRSTTYSLPVDSFGCQFFQWWGLKGRRLKKFDSLAIMGIFWFYCVLDWCFTINWNSIYCSVVIDGYYVRWYIDERKMAPRTCHKLDIYVWLLSFISDYIQWWPVHLYEFCSMEAGIILILVSKFCL